MITELEMRTLDDLRKEKGYKTDTVFAQMLEISPGFFSQVKNGFSPMPPHVFERLKNLFPNDDLEDIQFKKPNSKHHLNYKDILKTSSLKTEQNEQNKYKLNVFGNNMKYIELPIVYVRDRKRLDYLRQTTFEGLDVSKVPIKSLMEPQNQYFVLEAGDEPLVSAQILPGDQLLAYHVTEEKWSEIDGTFLFIPKDGQPFIMRVDFITNHKDGTLIFLPFQQQDKMEVMSSSIQSIYKIESIIYRQL